MLGLLSKRIFSLLLAVSLVMSLTPIPANAEQNTALNNIDVSAEIQALIAQGDPDATKVIVSGIENPDDFDVYLENLTEEEKAYVHGIGYVTADGAIENALVVAASAEEPVEEEFIPQADLTWSEYFHEGWNSMQETFYIESYGVTKSNFGTKWREAVNTCPEQFCFRYVWQYWWDDETEIITRYEPYYIYPSLAEYQAEQAKYEARVAEALSIIPENATDRAKIFLLHDWIINNVKYDDDAWNEYENSTDDNFNTMLNFKYPYIWAAYGVMVKGSAVCEGYSKALSDLLGRVGIPSTCLNVETSGHAWNMVFLDGSWYHIDATWDDSTSYSEPPDHTHKYFLKSDVAIPFYVWSDGTHTNWQNPPNTGWESFMVASDTTYDFQDMSKAFYWVDSYKAA